MRLQMIEPDGKKIPFSIVAEPQKYFDDGFVKYIAAASAGIVAGGLAFVAMSSRSLKNAQAQLNAATARTRLAAEANQATVEQKVAQLKAGARKPALMDAIRASPAYQAELERLGDAYLNNVYWAVRKDTFIVPAMSLKNGQDRAAREEAWPAELARLKADPQAMQRAGDAKAQWVRNMLSGADSDRTSILQARKDLLQFEQAQYERVVAKKIVSLEEESVPFRSGSVSVKELLGHQHEFRSQVSRGRFRSFVGGAGAGVAVTALVYGILELGGVIREAMEPTARPVPAHSNQTVNVRLAMTGVRRASGGFAQTRTAMAETRVVGGTDRNYLLALMTGKSRYLEYYSAAKPRAGGADKEPGAAGEVALYVLPLPSASTSCSELSMSTRHGQPMLRGYCVDEKGEYRLSSLNINECVPLADVMNRNGQLRCEETAPPGNYRGYFHFATADGRGETYRYDPWRGVLTVSSQTGTDKRRDIATLDYRKECDEGSAVDYDPAARRLYCVRRRAASGSAQAKPVSSQPVAAAHRLVPAQ